jgi:hypothetical protein
LNLGIQIDVTISGFTSDHALLEHVFLPEQKVRREVEEGSWMFNHGVHPDPKVAEHLSQKTYDPVGRFLQKNDFKIGGMRKTDNGLI